MGTRYYCDICGYKTDNKNELQQITRDHKTGMSLVCDLCTECADKLLKSVKEWHTEPMVELKLVEDK